MRGTRQQGFTLIELMLALGIGSILGAMFYMTLLAQQTAYLRQLDNVEAQQNARAALNILRNTIRQAGWGFATAPELVGAAAVGGCFTDPAAPAVTQFDCDNFDENRAVSGVAGTGELTQTTGASRAGSDRIRVVVGDPAGFSEHPDNHNDNDSLTLGDPIPSPEHPLSGMALVSGSCTDGSPNLFGADVFTISGTPADYSMAFFDTGVSRGCPPNPTIGYEDGFALGPASVVDFYIDRTQPRTPRLMMKDDPQATFDDASAVHVVAYDIDDLQMQYGLDIRNADGSSAVDRAVDIWCNDPRPGSATCDTGLTLAQNLARIVAVRIAVVPRTRNYKPELDYLREPDLAVSRVDVANHTIRRSGDGYTRWIYRATVALRNRDLR